MLYGFGCYYKWYLNFHFVIFGTSIAVAQKKLIAICNLILYA